jgi:hypothetical protein
MGLFSALISFTATALRNFSGLLGLSAFFVRRIFGRRIHVESHCRLVAAVASAENSLKR